MGETNKLKYNLLQQYLNGQLDPKRMHELEKDALEDPFLAEALDGYESIKGSLHPHLSILQRQLEDRIAQKQVKKNAMFFTWQRLSVAAAASLLFVSASILFWMKGTNRSAQVASNPKQTEVKLTAKDQLGKEEAATNLTNEEELVALTVPNKTVQSRSLPSKDFRVQSADVSTGRTKVSNSGVPLVRNEKKALETEVNDKPASSIASANTDLLIASASKASRSSSATVQRKVIMAQKESSNSLNEVVVGYGARVKQRLAEPAAGWKAYRDYLAKNQNAALKTTTADSVIVLFQIDAQGNPIHLNIEKGIDELHNQEAIRLIKQGPLWQSNKDEGLLQGRVTVNFNSTL